jgi:hypothetical protein
VQLLRGIGVVLAISILLGCCCLYQHCAGCCSMCQPVLIVSIPVLFQPELRRALETSGARTTCLVILRSPQQPELSKRSMAWRGRRSSSQQGWGR